MTFVLLLGIVSIYHVVHVVVEVFERTRKRRTTDVTNLIFISNSVLLIFTSYPIQRLLFCSGGECVHLSKLFRSARKATNLQ